MRESENGNEGTARMSFERRSFLRMGAVAAAGVAAAGLVACSPGTGDGNTTTSETTSTSSWRTAPAAVGDSEIVETYDCDVLVIGLGHAGCTALRAASEAGASVCAMVNQPESSMVFMSGGQVGHINSQFLGGNGVPTVDAVEFVNDWQVRSNNRSNPGLVMNYTNNCGTCFDWLTDCLTSGEKTAITIREWPNSDARHMTNYSGVKTWVGTANTGSYQTAMLQNCISIAVNAGGKIYYGTTGSQLITDSSGAVTGAYGKNDSGYVRVNASKGVIIATGDFSGNTDMCKDLLTEIVNAMGPDDSFSSVSGRDGSGIQMGYWAGGRLDPCMSAMDGAYIYPCDSPTDPLGATSALWINANGERYCNEGFGSTELEAFPGARQPSGDLYTIFDSNYEALIKAQPFGHMSFDYVNSDFSSLATTLTTSYTNGASGSNGTTTDDSSSSGGDKATMAATNVFAADTVETLGTYLGFTGTTLTNFVATVKRYNELCAQGIDEDFGKDSALLFPISNPPYYGYHGKKELGSIMVTTSGLLIDKNGQVLSEDYQPIKGLFAAGNASGSRFGFEYFTSIAGESLSMAQTMGMVTGGYVAKL